MGSNYTTGIPDIYGDLIKAHVGDVIVAYCITSKRVRVTKIEGIKKGFKTGMKYSPKPKECLWLRKDL